MKRPDIWRIAFCLCALVPPAIRAAEPASVPAPRVGAPSRAQALPRKVVVASAVVDPSGPVETRLKLVAGMIDDAARKASAQYPGHGLDLMVFPEFTLLRE